MDIAEEPSHPAALVVVGQQPERGEIRLEQHVRLLDPDEALDGRPIEHDLAVERLVELDVGHLDVLVHAEDVGKLEPEEVHAELLGQLLDVPLAGAAQVGGERFPRRAAGRRSHATSRMRSREEAKNALPATRGR